MTLKIPTVNPKEDHIAEDPGEDKRNVYHRKPYTVTYVVYSHNKFFWQLSRVKNVMVF